MRERMFTGVKTLRSTGKLGETTHRNQVSCDHEPTDSKSKVHIWGGGVICHMQAVKQAGESRWELPTAVAAASLPPAPATQVPPKSHPSPFMCLDERDQPVWSYRVIGCSGRCPLVLASSRSARCEVDCELEQGGSDRALSGHNWTIDGWCVLCDQGVDRIAGVSPRPPPLTYD
jgi:hypothetical protein